MFISKVKYEVEKLKYQQRIEYLENIICPCESHDYKEINFHFEGDTGATIYHFRCTKCGKYKEGYNYAIRREL